MPHKSFLTSNLSNFQKQFNRSMIMAFTLLMLLILPTILNLRISTTSVPTSITDLFTNPMHSITLVFLGLFIMYLCYKQGCIFWQLPPLKRHFTEQEILTLVTSLCFSKLYYGSQVWLLTMLKESLYRKLFSQSGQCLSICNRELSYTNLHKNT
jgi:hypothetical protein